MYCIDTDTVSLKTFGFDGKDNELLNLKSRRAIKISIKDLADILNSNFKVFNNKAGKSVAFVRNCTIFDYIQADFLKQISIQHEGIIIKNIDIKPQNKLPENFENSKLLSIGLAKTNSSNSTFKVTVKDSKSNIKNVYFKYNFTAQMPILLATNNIKKGQILDPFDYQSSYIDFDKFQNASLNKLNSSKLVAKSDINSGTMLLKNHFFELSLVKKGDKLNAVFNEGGLSLIIEVTALQNGNLGDDILVKTSDKKSLKANISSKNQVILR